jgi:hypothetical protein
MCYSSKSSRAVIRSTLTSHYHDDLIVVADELAAIRLWRVCPEAGNSVCIVSILLRLSLASWVLPPD